MGQPIHWGDFRARSSSKRLPKVSNLILITEKIEMFHPQDEIISNNE